VSGGRRRQQKEVVVTVAIPERNHALQPKQHSPNSIENVVLPLDSTSVSRPGLPVARKLAQFFDATLHLIYIGEPARNSQDALIKLGLTAEEMHGAVLNHTQGESAAVVMESARALRNSLIVMSTQMGAQTVPERFGSITESVLAAKPERIVLLTPERGDQAWEPRRIVLAHDGTPTCNATIAPTIELAYRLGAEVIALHVAEHGAPRPGEPGSLPAPLYVDQPQHEWPTWANEFMNRLLATGAPPSAIHFQLAVTGGQPGSEVSQLARERHADLVVMAWHGHCGQKTSATRVVIRNSGCPVFLVCPEEEAGAINATGVLETQRCGPDAIIFDLDGVITFTARVHAAAWKELFDQFLKARASRLGEPFKPFDIEADYRDYVDGKPRYDGVVSFLASRGIEIPYGSPSDPPQAETVCGLGNRKDELFVKKVHEVGIEVDHDALRFVRELRQHGVRVGLASSSKNAVPILEQAGIRELFEAIVDGVVSERLHLHGKPQPDIFLQSLTQLIPHADPGRAGIVEDATAGVEAGRLGRFGLVLGVDRYHTGLLARHGANWVIHDFSKITAAQVASFFVSQVRAA
jgi:beta-phosphoglucomutase-like phosphatase (HAD superfamily)/nucleotide-binding universal stress UspA family protein